jgi:hypothetical protein
VPHWTSANNIDAFRRGSEQVFQSTLNILAIPLSAAIASHAADHAIVLQKEMYMITAK